MLKFWSSWILDVRNVTYNINPDSALIPSAVKFNACFLFLFSSQFFEFELLKSKIEWRMKWFLILIIKFSCQISRRPTAIRIPVSLRRKSVRSLVPLGAAFEQHSVASKSSNERLMLWQSDLTTLTNLNSHRKRKLEHETVSLSIYKYFQNNFLNSAQ